MTAFPALVRLPGAQPEFHRGMCPYLLSLGTRYSDMSFVGTYPARQATSISKTSNLEKMGHGWRGW